MTLPTSSILICSRLFLRLGAIRGHFGGFIPIWTGTAFVGPASALTGPVAGGWPGQGSPRRQLSLRTASAVALLWTLAPLFNLRRATSSLHCKISTCFWRGAGCTQFMPGAAHRLRGSRSSRKPVRHQSRESSPLLLASLLPRRLHTHQVDSNQRFFVSLYCPTWCRHFLPNILSYPTSFCSPCRHRPSLTGLVFLRRRLEAVVILCCILPVLFLRAFIARSVASACSIPACVSHHFRCE